MNNLERFGETSLPNKESFYSNLNMENIDDIDYRHGNNVFKRFKLKILGECHDLYVQSTNRPYVQIGHYQQERIKKLSD